MEERRPEQQQEGQGRDDDRDRMAHDPTRKARPGSLGAGRARDAPDGEAVHPRAQDGEQRRQQRQRRGDRQPDHDRAGDPDRAQDHELEQDQPEQPEQDGQAAEEDGPAGGRDRDPDRLRRRGRVRPGRVASSSRKRLVISSE